MNLRTPLIALTLALVASPLFAAEPNTLTAAEKSAGWKLLFDGKSLNGWRGYKTEAIGAGWKVQDGALVLTEAKAGDLLTAQEFGDFELSFDWKISEGGNSGVIYRAGLGESAPYRFGPEYQVLDNEKAMIAASKFKDWPKFASLSRGHIALQDHGDVVSYRSIKIRELR